MKQGVTTKQSMARVPAPCPQCGHITSWSPTRVWCPWCSFQTATKEGENYRHTIVRWNRAVRNGIGYIELIRENNERELKRENYRAIRKTVDAHQCNDMGAGDGC